MKQELVKGHYAQTLMGLCDNHDLGSLRVGDVIAASGMSKPTFYHHFSNLSELVTLRPRAPTSAREPSYLPRPISRPPTTMP